ncbi:uncharacterized protein LOC123589087 [Leopardus geoffroyi]|uniref:uncharacterized protein LOC123589087 n=1 Tax=Leopardus geoffroyi TaxID=46844 RepID=UPI001E25EE61|nr:uncharacterized protein LOC123589087 [Leopardus geoffroyi]
MPPSPPRRLRNVVVAAAVDASAAAVGPPRLGVAGVSGVAASLLQPFGLPKGRRDVEKEKETPNLCPAWQSAPPSVYFSVPFLSRAIWASELEEKLASCKASGLVFGHSVPCRGRQSTLEAASATERGTGSPSRGLLSPKSNFFKAPCPTWGWNSGPQDQESQVPQTRAARCHCTLIFNTFQTFRNTAVWKQSLAVACGGTREVVGGAEDKHQRFYSQTCIPPVHVGARSGSAWKRGELKFQRYTHQVWTAVGG